MTTFKMDAKTRMPVQSGQAPPCGSAHSMLRTFTCTLPQGHDGNHHRGGADGLSWPAVFGVPPLRVATDADPVNHPAHYTSDPSGVECISITQHRNFCIGNAIKYLWRAGLKDQPGTDLHDKQIEDLEKARWYIAQEIERLRSAQ